MMMTQQLIDRSLRTNDTLEYGYMKIEGGPCYWGV